MCQARGDGGRRCPIHRHDSVAYMLLAEKDTGLNKRQVENIFRELSREGRHTADPTEEQWRALLTAFQSKVNQLSGHRVIKNSLERAFNNFSVPDGKTYYALQKLKETTEKKADRLEDLFAQVAAKKGMPIANVKRRFSRYSNAVDISRGAGTPEGYSQQAYLYAKNNNLPYDKSSVVAIQQLRDLPSEQEEINRVQLIDLSQVSIQGISSMGYNAEGGRFELKLNNNFYAYQNVSEEEWDEAFNDGQPNDSKISLIMNNPEYKYSNRAEEIQDKYNIKCESCGQFASPISHQCPSSVVNDVNNLENGNSNVNAASVRLRTTLASVGTLPTRAERNARRATRAAGNLRREFIFHQENQEDLKEKSNFELDEIPISIVKESQVKTTDLNVYNPASPSLINQIENSIYSDSLPKSVIEADLPNNFQGYIRYISVKNASNCALHTRSDSYNFNGFEEQLKEDLELPHPKLTAIVRVGNEEKSKIISVHPSNRFATVKTTSDSIIVSMVSETVPTYNENISYTAQEIAESNNNLTNLKNLDLKPTFTKTIIFDAALESQPKIRLPKVADLRKALSEDEDFVMPITISGMTAQAKESLDYENFMLDDQGYKQAFSPTGWRNPTISGNIQYSKDSSGNFKAINNPQTLSCSCMEWRKKNYCAHVESTLRKANNFIAQSVLPVNKVIRERVNISSLPNAQFLTAKLSRRTDLTITPPDEANNISLNYAFNDFNANERSARIFSEKIKSIRMNLSRNYKMSGEYESNTFEAYEEAKIISKTYNDLRSVKTIDNLKPIIKDVFAKKGSITIPYGASFAKGIWLGENNVTGNVTLASDENGQAYVKGDSLQCDCEDYREDYRCKHIKVASALSTQMLITNDELHSRSREQTPNVQTIIHSPSNENSALYDAMYTIKDFNINNGVGNILSIQDLRTQALAVLEEQEQSRREYEERWRTMRSRGSTESINNRIQASINSWKDENPERAAAIVTYRENMMSKWENVEPSYTNNPELAKTAIQEALDRKTAGKNPIVFREGGVLDGMSDGTAGRKFGIELEFDVPENNRRATLRKIGMELKEAGLTTSSTQQPYHSAGNNGYATWSYEEDCTVDAELVSPILDDSPESWEQVRKATEIITRNGGKATTRAGSHVHISTGSYENSSAKRAELLRFNREHQDLIYRLASDPKRGTHRGWQWCSPNIDDSAGELNDEVNNSANIFSGDHGSHNVGLNLNAMSSNLTSSNVEYRFWDATLDAGTIQAQVMMSAAMTDYAERTVIKEKKTLVRESVNSIGHAKSKETEQYELEGDTGFASFVDKLFRKDEDKSQIASLFAVTNWQQAGSRSRW